MVTKIELFHSYITTKLQWIYNTLQNNFKNNYNEYDINKNNTIMNQGKQSCKHGKREKMNCQLRARLVY